MTWTYNFQGSCGTVVGTAVQKHQGGVQTPPPPAVGRGLKPIRQLRKGPNVLSSSAVTVTSFIVQNWLPASEMLFLSTHVLLILSSVYLRVFPAPFPQIYSCLSAVVVHILARSVSHTEFLRRWSQERQSVGSLGWPASAELSLRLIVSQCASRPAPLPEGSPRPAPPRPTAWRPALTCNAPVVYLGMLKG